MFNYFASFTMKRESDRANDTEFQNGVFPLEHKIESEETYIALDYAVQRFVQSISRHSSTILYFHLLDEVTVVTVPEEVEVRILD